MAEPGIALCSMATSPSASAAASFALSVQTFARGRHLFLGADAEAVLVVSAVEAELLKKDPYNRLHARAPRYRLGAEFVRDGALAASGLLDRDLGGPSVHPYQPDGLWAEVSHYGYPAGFTSQK